MKIFFAVVVIVLLFVIGATLYVYKKSAMFLPALLGICGFPKIKESSYYDENGHFRPGTGEDKVGFFMQHPVFGGFKHMFFNVEDNVLKAIAPVKYKDFLKAPGREEQLDAALESFNYLTGLVEKGQARLVSDLYPAEAVKGHPYRSHLTGMFYQGQQGKPLAIVVPGGGFISNVTDCEGYPVAMKLHKMGYSVFVVSYPVGRQLGETEQVKQGQAAARELTHANLSIPIVFQKSAPEQSPAFSSSVISLINSFKFLLIMKSSLNKSYPLLSVGFPEDDCFLKPVFHFCFISYSKSMSQSVNDSDRHIFFAQYLL